MDSQIVYGTEPQPGRLWDVLFWISLGLNLSAMQFLMAYVMVAPFVVFAAGLQGFLAWLPLLIFQALYVGGIYYACVVRRRRPFISFCTLIATPIAIYGAAYFMLKAGLLNHSLTQIFS